MKKIISCFCCCMFLFPFFLMGSGCRRSVNSVEPDGGEKGGTVTSVDSDAPKKINSEDIVLFEIECNFVSLAERPEHIYVYAYAAKTDGGVLAALETRTGLYYESGNEVYSKVALVDEDLLTELQKTVKKYGYASSNGGSHFVNGLPENFGGHVRVDYASGEKIGYDDNQSPVISSEAGEETAKLLRKFIEKKNKKTGDAGSITGLAYLENRGENSYTRYVLKDGKLMTEACYGTPDKVYRHEYDVPDSALAEIRKLAEDNALLGWKGLDDSSWTLNEEKIVFSLNDGSEAVITGNMTKPKQADRIIYEIYSLMDDLTD